jgi:hypothetical protein
LRLAIATSGSRPTKFGSGAEGVIEFQLERAASTASGGDDRERLSRERAKLDELVQLLSLKTRDGEAARALATLQVAIAVREKEAAAQGVDVATVQFKQMQAQVEAARAHLAVATQRLQEAEAKLAAAEKKARNLSPNPPAETARFTIHIRPLSAAEKVVRVKATGKETVMEGLAYAAEDMAITPDALAVWVVRDKSVLAVDLAAIYRGDAKTNHTLKPGDQLFVQVKVGK